MFLAITSAVLRIGQGVKYKDSNFLRGREKSTCIES